MITIYIHLSQFQNLKAPKKQVFVANLAVKSDLN